MRHNLCPVAIATALVVLLAGAAAIAAEGKRAPDFTLHNLDGKKVSLDDLTGNGPVLLSLWALWCRPCLEEMPHIQAIHDKYGDKGLTVVAVSEDSPRSQSRVKSFLKNKKYSFLVLRDPNGELTRKFKTRLIPFTAILDSEGRIVHSRAGYRKGQEKELEKIVLELLKKDTPAAEGT